jgi:hypothetical protein
MLSPRAEALAFRVWQFAEPLGWDCTVGEIAAAIDVDPRLVGRVCAAKGWASRLRGGERRSDFVGGSRSPACSEAMLDGEGKHATVARYARLADEAHE